MSLPRISIQALEAFERVAQSGSMQTTASEMGLSISTISHHISRLEEHLGVTLFNRSSRPFVLTQEGQNAFDHLSKGLFHLRRATSETEISGLLGTRALRIGIVEDFESNVTPELAVILARQMPRAKLTICNVLSHEAPALLRNGEIDVAVASEAERHATDIQSAPLVRDPFVVVVPVNPEIEPADLFAVNDDLPFLRFNPGHMIGKQIEGHLARSRVAFSERFAFDSAQSIMAIVANGDGWSVITPLGFMRAQRFAKSVRLHPVPFAAFARNITLMSRAGFDSQTRQAIAGIIRQIIAREAVDPIHANYPWLKELFMVLEPAS